MSIKANVENLGPCKKMLRLEVEAAKVDEALAEASKEINRHVRIPGFRPGKAPIERVQKDYREDIEKEAKRQLINEGLHQALNEHHLDAVSYGEVEEIKFEKGQPFSFALTVETAPDFQLPEYRRLPVKREVREVTDEDVNQGIEALRGQGATYETVTRAAQDGDVVVVNYRGTVDGKPITEISPVAKGLTEKQGFWVEIRPDSFLPGFPEQLKGSSAGDKKTISVQFPADFVPGELAGRQGSYEVEVVEIKERRVPELTDELAKKWGAENVTALREGVRRDLQGELNDTQRRSLRSQAIKALFDRVDFELPESFVDQETRNAVYEIVSENTRRGVSKEVIEKEKEGIYSAATRTARDRVKAAYLFGAIASKEGIEVSGDEVLARVTVMAQGMKVAPPKLLQDLKKNKRIVEIQQQLLNDKVITFLVENASVEDVAPAPADSKA